jgi:phosphoadenosine phosphosulfate reductase
MRDQLTDELNNKFTDASPEQVIEYFLKEYHGRILQATSMGIEDQVITHMIAAIDKSTRIVTLDTGRLFQETYDLIEKTNEKYGIAIELLFPDFRKVEEMTGRYGINLFYKSLENRKMCCNIRKDEPISRALKGQKAWICGLRKDQTVTRFFNKLVEWDVRHELIRVNPLINWAEKQVWGYIRDNNIPFNILYDKGFTSIGCQPCTRAIQPGEDSRAGRWWWEQPEHKECGLHAVDGKLAGKAR